MRCERRKYRTAAPQGCDSERQTEAFIEKHGKKSAGRKAQKEDPIKPRACQKSRRDSCQARSARLLQAEPTFSSPCGSIQRDFINHHPHQPSQPTRSSARSLFENALQACPQLLSHWAPKACATASSSQTGAIHLDQIQPSTPVHPPTRTTTNKRSTMHRINSQRCSAGLPMVQVSHATPLLSTFGTCMRLGHWTSRAAG